MNNTTQVNLKAYGGWKSIQQLVRQLVFQSGQSVKPPSYHPLVCGRPI